MKTKITIILSLMIRFLGFSQPEIPKALLDRELLGYGFRLNKIESDTTLSFQINSTTDLIEVIDISNHGDTIYKVEVLKVIAIDTLFRESKSTGEMEMTIESNEILVPDGNYIEFPSSQSINRIEGQFADGQKHGMWTFKKHGAGYIEITYKNDLPDGPIRSYYSEGKIEWVGQYGAVEYRTLDYNNSFELVPTTRTKTTRVDKWTHYNIFQEVDEIVTYERK